MADYLAAGLIQQAGVTVQLSRSPNFFNQFPWILQYRS